MNFCALDTQADAHTVLERMRSFKDAVTKESSAQLWVKCIHLALIRL